MFTTNRKTIAKSHKIRLNDMTHPKFFLNNDYVVVGYGCLIRNDKSRTQTLVKTYFVNLSDLQKQTLEQAKQGEINSPKGAFIIDVNVPIGLVRKLPIGTIVRKLVQRIIKNQGKEQEVLQAFLKPVQKLDFSQYTYVLQHPNNQDVYRCFAKTLMADNDSAIINFLNPFVQLTSALDKALLYSPVHKFKFYRQDNHSWICTFDKQQQKIFLLNPVLLLTSHYGASSEVARILLSEPLWDKVLEKFNYHYYNHNNGSAVLISDGLAISDCVFLSHLKNDDETLTRVKRLHSNVTLELMSDKKNSWLQVEPYHNQPISLSVKGVEVGNDVVWVTEIVAISEPVGKAVYFDIYGKVKVDDKGANDNSNTVQGLLSVQSANILSRSLIDDTVLICDENVDNGDMAVIKSNIGIIDEQAREKIFNEAIIKGMGIGSLTGSDLYDEQVCYVVKKDEALRFAMGERIGSGGEVGFLAIVNGELALDDNDSKVLQGQYQYLAEKARQAFKQVRGFSFKKGVVDTPTVMRVMYQKSHPKTVLVLITSNGDGTQKYIWIDCEKTDKLGSSGLIFKWKSEWSDLNVFKEFIWNVLVELANHRGSLGEKSGLQEWLADNNIRWAKYKHTQNGDWVKNALSNIRDWSHYGDK